MKINKNGFRILDVQNNLGYSSSGTSGMGYIEHRGLTFIVEDYEGFEFELNGYLTYTPQGYANLKLLSNTDYYPRLNGRIRPHYLEYQKMVHEYHNKYVNIEILNKLLSDRVVNSKSALVKWFKSERYMNDYDYSKII